MINQKNYNKGIKNVLEIFLKFHPENKKPTNKKQKKYKKTVNLSADSFFDANERKNAKI